MASALSDDGTLLNTEETPSDLASTAGGSPPAASGALPPASGGLGSYLVWNPPQSSPATPASVQSLPDSYFEPTAGELQAAFSSQSRLVAQLREAPLKTQAIRDREAREKAARWPETRIRIKFPNQLQLEKKFSSTDKIKSVYAFVRSALTEEAKPNKFVLFEAPRRELKVSDPEVKNQSLIQLGLAPSTVLHLLFVDESLNSSTAPPPLLPEILSQGTDLPPPPSFDQPLPKDKGTQARSTGSGSASASSSGDKKLPKWLKLGKK